MNILFITAEGFDTPNPNNQMAETMMREFTDRGNKVTLIQSHRKGINPDVPSALTNKKGLKIYTIRRPVVDKTKFMRRYVEDAKYAFKAKKIWRKIHNADIVYLQSNPTIIFPIFLLKIHMKKTPIIYSIYDVFPGHAKDIGVIGNNVIFEILRCLQKLCYILSDGIIVQSDDMKEKVLNQGVKKEKIYIAEPWYDSKTTSEIIWSENKFVKKYRITKDKFHVQFAGSISYVFDYKAVIGLAERLKYDDDIEIQIIGDGTAKQAFIDEAMEKRLDNIKFFPLQPVDLVPDVYSECDVCIIPLKKGVIGNGVPSKAGILMTCKRPIVSSVEMNSSYARMFSDYDMGIAVETNDYNGFANAIRYLRDNPKRREEMVNNAYEYSKNHYSSDVGISNMLNAFDKVIQRSR